MTKTEIKKLVQENVSLKRALQQKEEKITLIKKKVDTLNNKNKSISAKLERSKKRGQELQAILSEEQKKTLNSI